MKTFLKQTLRIKLSAKILYLTIFILISYSCEKENDPKIDFEFKTNEIIFYPYSGISITFDIIPKNNIGTYTIFWYNPHTLIGKGPYKISIAKNLILDFEISDSTSRVQRFQYEIRVDTIDDRMRYDYRNQYIGTYKCIETFEIDGSTRYYIDTLIVVKDDYFEKIAVFTKFDNYSFGLTYQGPYLYFQAFRASLLFSGDSIDFSYWGRLIWRFRYTYKGIKITQ